MLGNNGAYGGYGGYGGYNGSSNALGSTPVRDNFKNQGGFMTESPMGGGSQDVKKESISTTIRPVTIKQLGEINGMEPPFTLDGVEVSSVKVVGAVKSVSSSSVNFLLTLDDGTGSIEAKRMMSGSNEGIGYEKFVPGTLVACYAIFKIVSGKPQLTITNVRLAAPDEASYHQLSAKYCTLYHTRGPLNQVKAPANTVYNANYQQQPQEFNSMFNRVQNEILKCVKDAPATKDGAYIPDIIHRLRGVASEAQIRQDIEYLHSEGHIFSTIDEDHIQVTSYDY